MSKHATDLIVEDSDIIAAFRQLNVEQMASVGYEAYSSALPMIAQSAGNVLASEGINIDSIGKSGKSMRQGFTVKAYRDGTGGSVTAFGEYKLKWFVTGTEERWQDQKHEKTVAGQAHRYLGRIYPTFALERGYDEVEEQFFSEIEDHIVESINRLMNK